MSDKKLVLIDGYNFLFRAYYAIRNLSRSDGLPTGALFGFTRMIMSVLVDIHSTHLAVVFDTGKKNFRHKLYPKYKANRPPAPEDLIPQFPLARRAVEALNVNILEKVGFEADDVIATLAKRAEKQDFEVLIISSDKDLMQLVNDKIAIYDGMKKKKIGIKEVKEKWDVSSPEKVLEILALTGDSSDNVPGVPGIGPKTAALLINKYGSVEEVIKNVGDIRQNKRRENIEKNIENIKLSKELIKLDKDVDVGISLKDLAVKKLDPEKFIRFLKEMEFRSIAKKMETAFGIKVEDKKGEEEFDLFYNQDPIKDRTTKKKKGVDSISGINIEDYDKKISKSDSLHKEVESLKGLQEIVAKAEYDGKLFMEIQTETIQFNSGVVSIVLSSGGREVYFVKIKSDDKNKAVFDLFKKDKEEENKEVAFSLKEVAKELKGVLENEDVLKIGYDIKKQVKILNSYGVWINPIEDVSVMSYILDAGLYSQKLSSVITENLIRKKVKYNWHLPLSYKQMSIEEKTEVLKNYEKDKVLFELTKNVFEIGCFCVEAVKALYLLFKQRLYDERMCFVYERFERPLTQILAKMEIAGIKVNIVELNRLSNEFSKKIHLLEKEVYKMSGVEFNIGSPKQLSEVLFTKLKLPPDKKSSKTGLYSTSIDVMEKLESKGFKIATKILEWRHFSKLKTTYTDTLPKQINKETGRVHTTFSNITAATGRLSANNPNLQNIPIRSDEGSKIRRAFVAQKGYKLISADYSQVELRVLANYAKVKLLSENFKENKDVHTATAVKVFGLKKEKDVTSEMRRIAKAVNFSIVYGTSAYGLASRIKTTYSEAKQYIENYFKIYPEVKEYMNKSKEFAKENGYVRSLFGRKCYVNMKAKGPSRGFAERLAINAPMQGTAADIIKKAMIDLDAKLSELGSKARMILQVHDELILEVPKKEASKISELLKDTMEGVLVFDVPLIVEVGVGDNWAEIH